MAEMPMLLTQHPNLCTNMHVGHTKMIVDDLVHQLLQHVVRHAAFAITDQARPVQANRVQTFDLDELDVQNALHIRQCHIDNRINIGLHIGLRDDILRGAELVEHRLWVIRLARQNAQQRLCRLTKHLARRNPCQFAELRIEKPDIVVLVDKKDAFGDRP